MPHKKYLVLLKIKIKDSQLLLAVSSIALGVTKN